MSDTVYVLSIDEGTTGTTAILFDGNGRKVSHAYREIQQIYPQSGWVEHDPQEIFRQSVVVAEEAVEKAGIAFSSVAGLGITNQRETVVVWDRRTGEPVSNAVVWQCRRTAPFCEGLKDRGFGPFIQQRTGLMIDAYFSASKIRWVLDNLPDGQKRAEQGDLLFGTIDTWLIWNLTGGKIHVTDFSNASRTMLFNITTFNWDKELLDVFNIPAIMMPRPVPSSSVYGETAGGLFNNSRLPVAGIAGDQQAALFGQACFHPGMAKNTYGTGSFVLVNTGRAPVFSEKGLITTLAWQLDNEVTYAMEGSIFVTGAAVQWLRDGLGLIRKASEIEALAMTVPDNGGVYFVPAFVGLGTPYWDMYARGTIVGLTRGSNKGHLARAVLEAIAFQARDVIDTMKTEAGIEIPVLRVDGGGSLNNLTMQFQADILGIPIQRSAIEETTALGAAYLAGLAVGVWQDLPEIEKKWAGSAVYEPRMSADQRESLYGTWKQAVRRAAGWVQP